MSQASFLSPPAAEGKRAQVLLPLPLAKAYDYVLPEGMLAQAGDYVRVPIGRREAIGVVWSDAADQSIDKAKLKYVQHKFDFPALPAVHRQFLDWVARYTMSEPGAVLKMTLSAMEALEPPKSSLSYTLPDILPQKLSSSRKKIADVLSDGILRRASEIAEAAGCTPSVIRSMAAAGQLRAVETSAPVPCQRVNLSASNLTFSGHQAEAIETLTEMVEARKFGAALLDGVTGSGKTEVYFEAVAETVKQGKQALILLPEISLSTQFLERFERRFGTKPAIWHSEVSPVQRRIAWTGVAQGETKVVIGARSALFLPFANLGLIVVDEEHDASYKQEEGVLYNARDMAVVRARLGDFPVALVSATPSLETMTNVREGKYQYLRLPTRHAGAKMPDIHVVDLKKTPPDRQRFLSPSLIDALQKNFEAKEQSLLFLNRRGYAPLTLCRICGHRFQCPSCTAWLVEHKRQGRLQCHHCAYSQSVPKECPSCQDDSGFAACGPGVERIQEEVQALLPEARTMVLASDVMTSQAMMQKAIGDIESHQVDIIIGTQMIAKGHHFPALTLVGVVDADLGLAGGDLRAGERTFQLLHQVSGRAGRETKPGRVYLQTYMPEQSVIRALAANDRDAFLAAETAERERALMPPFGRLAAVIVSGPDELKLDHFCRMLAQRAPRYDDIRILGPAPAPMAYLRGRYRRRFLIKTGRGINIQKYLAEWLEPVKIPSAIQLKTDIDPQSFF
jgi:primosomal protein N' (replication factor Y)